MSFKRSAIVVAFLSWLSNTAVFADTHLPTDISIWIDFRGAYSNTGKEWLDGGLSKTRYGSSEEDGYDAELAEFTALWSPTFSAGLSGHLHLQAGPDQDVGLGVVEGYLKYRILPIDGWRVSARAGRFFPPVSLEHDGPGWGLTRTLTPSAINSWIGEEVAVVGTELRTAKRFGDHIIDLRGAAFGFNDTAGALLAYRGWAQHDVKSVQFGKFAVPDVGATNPELIEQSMVTEPSRELDDKLGFYASANWRYTDQFEFSALAYDNNADPLVLQNGQYGWATRFLSLGAAHHPVEGLEIIAQAMLGETGMGPRMWANRARAVDNEISSAFLMGSWRANGGDILSARIEMFATTDRSNQQSFSKEQGWSATSSWRRSLSDNIEIGAELLYIEHDREIQRIDGDQSGGLQTQWLLRAKF